MIKLYTIHPGSLSDQELLDTVAPELRYDTYIRYNNILLTTMFREVTDQKLQYSKFLGTKNFVSTEKDLGSLACFVSYLKRRIAYSSVAVNNGNGVGLAYYDQPLPNMGGVTLNDLAQDVLVKLFKSGPKIVTKSYLLSMINSVGIDHIRRAKVRLTSNSNITVMDNTDSLSSLDVETLDALKKEGGVSTMVLDPYDDLVFSRLLEGLSELETKIVIGRMYNDRSEDIAGYSGICRRQVFMVLERIRENMG